MIERESSPERKKKGLLRRMILWLHLWLGLLSGLVVFVIAVTGCIYAFQVEIRDLTEDFRFVTLQEKPFLLPTQMRAIADAELPGKHPHAVLYGEKHRAAQVIYYSAAEHYYDIVFLNPYSGAVLKVKDMHSDFFSIILEGHFYLWLPDEIGQPVAATSTLIFVVLLVTGIILWSPHRRTNVKQRFTIRWNARWRRKNFDLHSVVGFYVSWIALLLALTGLTWGFKWFAGSVYAVASGGKEYKAYCEPASDTLQAASFFSSLPGEDRVWLKVQAEHPEAEVVEVHYPVTSSSSILATINSDDFTYWKRDFRFFDQYTLKELSVDHTWGRLKDASGADKLMRMNYDIHVGAILGLPGKILAFIASLLVASLPVTGVLLWLGRKRKRKREVIVAEKVRKEELV